MELLPGVSIPRDLVLAIVDAARMGHRLAQSHHNDPGSNGYTFGSDRYHRTCELAREALEAGGWSVRTHGAGHRARKGDLELWFATARTADVHAPSSFDNRSDSRLDAGNINGWLQPRLDGLEDEEVPAGQVVHFVFSGNSSAGLLAVHAGRLVSATESSVEWLDVRRVDTLDASGAAEPEQPDVAAAPPAYDAQPEPSIDLPPKTPAAEEDDSDATQRGS